MIFIFRLVFGFNYLIIIINLEFIIIVGIIIIRIVVIVIIFTIIKIGYFIYF